MAPPRHFARLLAAAVLLALAVAAVLAFRGAGRWLIREDPVTHAGVIVVLSGGMPVRAEEAGDIFRQGYAPEVWITHPQNSAERLTAMHIHYLAEDEYSQAILIHEGVPQASVRILENPILDTEEEVTEIAGRLRAEKKTSAILVTSPEHTRRVRVLWNKLAGSDLSATVRAAPQDPFDANRWWDTTADAFAVAREMLGLLNAWTGLHVRPR